MRKNLWWIIIGALFVVGSCGACAVGLNKVANKKLDRLNTNLEALDTKGDEIIAAVTGLREEVAGLKSTAAGQADVQVRIAEALESINKQVEDFLKLRKFISP